MIGRSLRAIGAIALLAATAASAQSVPAFKDVTPDSFAPAHILIHPLDGRRLMAISIGGSVRTSRDAGESWSTPPGLILNGVDRAFAHPGRPDVVFLQETGVRRARIGIDHWGGRLFRSNDFGATWTQLTDGYMAEGDLQFAPLASDPQLPERVVASLRSPMNLAIFGISVGPFDVGIGESLDGGATWDALPAPSSGTYGYRHVEGPTPAAPRRLFISAEDTFASFDGGHSWSGFQVLPAARTVWVRQHPGDASLLYASAQIGSAGGVLRSRDGGNSWEMVFPLAMNLASNPLLVASLPNFVGTLAFDPARPRRLWLTNVPSGVFLSEDGGDTWTNVGFQPAPCPSQGCVYGADPSTVAHSLVASPADTSQVYAIWKDRLYRGDMPRRQRIAHEYQYGDRYWITGDTAEALSQDYRANEAIRTGQRFGLWTRETAPDGARAMCRFQGNPSLGQSSRFVTLEGPECEAVKRAPSWTLEGEGEYFAIPTGADGKCAAGLVSVTRFNVGLGSHTNHRYVVHPTVAAEMRARGWIEEGVAFCARPLGSNE